MHSSPGSLVLVDSSRETLHSPIGTWPPFTAAFVRPSVGTLATVTRLPTSTWRSPTPTSIAPVSFSRARFGTRAPTPPQRPSDGASPPAWGAPRLPATLPAPHAVAPAP